MKQDLLLSILSVIVAASTSASVKPAKPNPWCEPTPAMSEALHKAYGENDGTLTTTQHSEQRLARLRSLREEHPEDLFVHLWYQSAWKSAPNSDPDPLIAEYRARRDAHPDDPVSTYLLASVLIGWQTKEATDLLDQILLQKPDLARAHLAQVKIAQMPAYRDKARALAHLKTFIDMCPAALDAFDFIRGIDDVEFLATSAQRLRAMLGNRENTGTLGYYGTLWSLEFRVTPIADHDRLRSRVAEDLKRLRRLKHVEERLNTLDWGYQLTQDKQGRAWVEEQFVKRLPLSYATMLTVTRGFDSEHPRPQEEGTPEQLRRYRQEVLTATDDWIRRWPDQPWVWSRRLAVLRESDDATAAQIERTADGLLNALARNPGLLTAVPPYSIQIAGLYLEKETRLERIPELVAQGLEEAERSDAVTLKSDWSPASEKKALANSLSKTQWEGWPILVRTSLKTSRPNDARTTLDQMWSALVQEARENLDSPPQEPARQEGVHAIHRASYWELMGELAEHENRSLDALGFYQKALSQNPGKRSSEDLTARIGRLWERLGGTAEGLNAWRAPGDVTAAPKESRETAAWEEKNKPLPDFALQDLSGKVWHLSDLSGKVAFVNIWATWCAPCVNELPHLAKLHEQLRDDKGVIILSLNVDTELGLVVPFVKKHGMAYPVIPAAAYVQDLLPMMSIPRNWIVSRTGILLQEQVGFGSDGEAWRQSAQQMIDKAR